MAVTLMDGENTRLTRLVEVRGTVRTSARWGYQLLNLHLDAERRELWCAARDCLRPVTPDAGRWCRISARLFSSTSQREAHDAAMAPR
jgi:hypothetical protein